MLNQRSHDSLHDLRSTWKRTTAVQVNKPICRSRWQLGFRKPWSWTEGFLPGIFTWKVIMILSTNYSSDYVSNSPVKGLGRLFNHRDGSTGRVYRGLHSAWKWLSESQWDLSLLSRFSFWFVCEHPHGEEVKTSCASCERLASLVIRLRRTLAPSALNTRASR